MGKVNDVYEMILIAPIRRGKNLKQVRARARNSRLKLQRHEKATQMSVGDAVDVFDRILAAEQEMVAKFIQAEQWRGLQIGGGS